MKAMINLLKQLNLRFKDSSQEKDYVRASIAIESKLICLYGLICCIVSVGQIILNLVLGNEPKIASFVLASLTILTLLLPKKHTKIYAASFSVYTLSTIYYTSAQALIIMPAYRTGYNYVMGNAIGILEAMFISSLRKLWMKIFLVLIALILKLIAVREELNSADYLISICFISFSLIIYGIYQDYSERKNFSATYESKIKFEKLQGIILNDLSTNFIIIHLNLMNIIYSNSFFNERFGPDWTHVNNTGHKDFISSFFKKFKVESFLKSSDSTLTLLDKQDSLFDFLQTLSLNSEVINKEKNHIVSVTFSHSDNSLHHYEIKIKHIIWEGESCFAIIFNDISDKFLITALKTADEQKDRVIATVSHELRTPINGILGLLEMIGVRVEDTVARTYLQHCKSCSQLLLHLVNSILDLSLLRQNKLHIARNTFSLDELLEEMKSLYLFQTQQKGIEFIVDKGSDVPDEIYTDKFRLLEILINLLSNAFKFTFKGFIKLTVAIDQENHDKLVFSVKDTGLGIKEQDKAKLFQMFGKIKQDNKNVNAQGAGLGLNIAINLVKMLNNDQKEEIDFETEYQKGSKFSFRIPIKLSNDSTGHLSGLDDVPLNESVRLHITNMQEFSSADDPVYTKIENVTNRSVCPILSPSSSPLLLGSPCNRESSERRRNIMPLNPKTFRKQVPVCKIENPSKNVLVVDDNPFNLLTATFLLEKQGLKVTKATSGEQCLELLQNSNSEKKPFGIVFMDIEMPVQDGIETTKMIISKIKAGELYDVSVIALTANKVDSVEVKRYKESGIMDILEKPLKEEVLFKLLSKYFPT